MPLKPRRIDASSTCLTASSNAPSPLLDNWPQYKDLSLECSPITHLTANDPPVFLVYEDGSIGPPENDGIHHVEFARILLEAAEPQGLKPTLGYYDKAMLTGRHHWRKFHGVVGAFEPGFRSQRTEVRSQILLNKHLGKLKRSPFWQIIKTCNSLRIIAVFCPLTHLFRLKARFLTTRGTPFPKCCATRATKPQ